MNQGSTAEILVDTCTMTLERELELVSKGLFRDKTKKPVEDIAIVSDALEYRTSHCDKHGEYSEYKFQLGTFERWGGCPQCNAELIEQDDKRKAQERDSVNQHVRELPELYANAGLKNFVCSNEKQARIVERLRAYAGQLCAGECINLVMQGATGTGKTHLACAVLRNVAIDGKRSRYITSAELMQTIRSSWDVKTRTAFESEIIATFAAYDVLLIDEVGVDDQIKSDIWSQLIDARYRAKKPTILTTNLTELELKKIIGDRAYDRLFQNIVYAECAWTSYRQMTANVERI